MSARLATDYPAILSEQRSKDLYVQDFRVWTPANTRALNFGAGGIGRYELQFLAFQRPAQFALLFADGGFFPSSISLNAFWVTPDFVASSI
ncbi:hypothetical protein ACVMIX_002551 [Rhizobium leguminosarum]